MHMMAAVPKDRVLEVLPLVTVIKHVCFLETAVRTL